MCIPLDGIHLFWVLSSHLRWGVSLELSAFLEDWSSSGLRLTKSGDNHSGETEPALRPLPSEMNMMCFNNEWVINSNCFGELWCHEPYRTTEPSINDAGMHNRDVSICYKLHYKPASVMPLIYTSLTCYNTSLENGLGGNVISINHWLIKKKKNVKLR